MAWPKGKPRKTSSMVDDEIEGAAPTGEDVTYLPGEGDPHSVRWRGVEFKANVPVRITNASHLEAARGNRFYRVGAEASGEVNFGPPKTAMEYRGHVLDWLRSVETIDQLATHWAGDRNLRMACEVGQDDVSYLGTIVEPKLKALRLKEGLSDMDVAAVWVKHGVLDLPWRA